MRKWILTPALLSLKAFINMAANIMLNRVVARTHLYFNPSVTLKDSEYSPWPWRWANMPSWNWWTLKIKVSGHPNWAMTIHRPSQLTLSKAFLRWTNVMKSTMPRHDFNITHSAFTNSFVNSFQTMLYLSKVLNDACLTVWCSNSMCYAIFTMMCTRECTNSNLPPGTSH